MTVAFRADASLRMGSGHVMRCLTLAMRLRKRGADVIFLMRAGIGDMIQYVESLGFDVLVLDSAVGISEPFVSESSDLPVHSDWLGVHWKIDAMQAAAALNDNCVDWLVVDHYALDYRWQEAVAHRYRKLLVVDDLADRKHASPSILVDQTYLRDSDDYLDLTGGDTLLLCGAGYCLLRDEFHTGRIQSMSKEISKDELRVFLNLGGVDEGNVTSRVLIALDQLSKKVSWQLAVTVVLGGSCPHVNAVTDLILDLAFDCDLHVNSADMASLMSESAVAIGAAGATSWERCCLGLPAALVVLAENQKLVAQNLANAGAAWLIHIESLEEDLDRVFCGLDYQELLLKRKAAAAIVDGLGAHRVVERMEGYVG